MAENIVHLVLARVAGAPEGVKGISLFIVPEVPGQRRRLARRAQRRAGASASSTSSASRRARPRCCSSATRAARARRPGRDRHADRRGEPRPRVHVHHDERGALRGRHAGHRASPSAPTSRPRRSRSERVQSRPVDGSVAGSATDHPPPRRAPHADDDARLHRGLPRAGARRRGGVRRRAPPPGCRRCASRTRPSTSSWCRW